MSVSWPSPTNSPKSRHFLDFARFARDLAADGFRNRLRIAFERLRLPAMAGKSRLAPTAARTRPAAKCARLASLQTVTQLRAVLV